MKFYAVAKGRKTGIFTSWPEAERQVKGFAGARFKSFKTKEEALAFLKNPS
jgi:ribonuclease HI